MFSLWAYHFLAWTLHRTTLAGLSVTRDAFYLAGTFPVPLSSTLSRQCFEVHCGRRFFVLLRMVGAQATP
ncbi:hypothetical protein PISMIDRAFT_684889 [Pisolithus microcarpus 441]|uniref:Secreted protein n=1 Tax=Pisolithus microcarpus 441 TaxID=765257 RepID=A0A0C9YUW4_9AGAM|nr:hypothetical protein PISMIDRAFT_684889 [Pisolithus microcarpus 441]